MEKKSFLETCQTGDILLFRGDAWYSRLIEYLTGSNYSHIGLILRDPTYINPKLKGLYMIESNPIQEGPDVEDNKSKFGVQIIELEKIIENCKKSGEGLYYRKLNCDRNEIFNEKMKSIHTKVHNKSYNINPLDWTKAKFHIESGNTHKIEQFWCSALVAYIYEELGLLENDIPWTIIAPRRFSYYENERLSYKNCDVEPEIKIEI